MSKNNSGVNIGNKELDKLVSLEKNFISKEDIIKERIQEELKKPDMIEKVREFIFNKDISYEDNPLAEFRK